MIISSIWKSLGKGLGWIIDSVVNHTNDILKCNPLAGSSYIKLHKVSNYSKKGLINIQNIDEHECFKRCLVRYLHPADHHPAGIRKVDKDFARQLDFKI